MSSEEVVQQDPPFAEWLAQRRDVTAAIQRVRQTWETERRAWLEALSAQRAALRVKERTVQAQLRLADQRLDPGRDLVRAKLRDAEQQLGRAEATLTGLRRTERELHRLLQEQGAETVSDDARPWREQLALLGRRIPVLTAQRDALRRQQRLYRAEWRLLSR